MSFALYLLAGLLVPLAFINFLNGRKLRSIPTIGGSDLPLLSYLSAFNFGLNGPALLQRGYEKFKGRAFKVATFERWVVVVTGSTLVDEVQRLPDSKASLSENSAKLANSRWTFGQEFHDNPYLASVLRQQLPRHLSATFPDVQDEIEAAFKDLLLVPENGDWTSIPAMSVMRRVIARVSARMFVGLPYCRNEGYLQLTIKFTRNVIYGSLLLSVIPRPLKGLVAKCVTNTEGSLNSCAEYLHDLLYPRVQDMQRFGDDWTDKPDDLMQWLIDEELKTGKLDIKSVMSQLHVANFAAIFTVTNTLTHALYHLAANPELVQPLREEAEAVLEEEGCTRAAMGKLYKLDSFLRETLRFNGLNTFSISRLMMQDVVLSDGTALPAGTSVIAAATATHSDEANYTHADVFDPWRFVASHEEGGNSAKSQFTNTTPAFLPFGHGKHACPGRFFAANELKAMLVHLMMNYDVKFAKEGVRPPNKFLGLMVFPNPTAEVMFRRRVVSTRKTG